MSSYWMIEAKLKTGASEWEPISVERVSMLPDGRTERKYQYPELAQAHAAFHAFLDSEAGFPNVIMRLATGGPRFTDVYDVRFVAVTFISGNLPAKATAHLDAQPGTLVNPINKALLEALKRFTDVEDLGVSESVMEFARQAISEAEKGWLGENLGSPVSKGSDTEVRSNA